MTRRPVIPQSQRGWRASQRMAPGGRLYSESPVVPTRHRVLFAGEAEDTPVLGYVQVAFEQATIGGCDDIWGTSGYLNRPCEAIPGGWAAAAAPIYPDDDGALTMNAASIAPAGDPHFVNDRRVAVRGTWASPGGTVYGPSPWRTRSTSTDLAGVFEPAGMTDEQKSETGVWNVTVEAANPDDLAESWGAATFPVQVCEMPHPRFKAQTSMTVDIRTKLEHEWGGAFTPPTFPPGCEMGYWWYRDADAAVTITSNPVYDMTPTGGFNTATSHCGVWWKMTGGAGKVYVLASVSSRQTYRWDPGIGPVNSPDYTVTADPDGYPDGTTLGLFRQAFTAQHHVDAFGWESALINSTIVGMTKL